MQDSDKTAVVSVVREFVKLVFGIIATSGTATALEADGAGDRVFKIREGRPNVLDRVKNGDISLSLIVRAEKFRGDEVTIRNAAIAQKIRS